MINKFVNSDGQWLLSFYKIVTHLITYWPKQDINANAFFQSCLY